MIPQSVPSGSPRIVVTNEDIYALMGDLKKRLENSTAFKDGPPDSPRPRLRHQFMNLDFWFMFAAIVQLFLIFTSFIHTNAFEPLCAGSILCMLLAMMSNLTRDRVELPPKRATTRQPLFVINFGGKPSPSLTELQRQHGIKMVKSIPE